MAHGALQRVWPLGPEAESPVIYALFDGSEYWFCDPSKRFAPSYGKPSAKNIFSSCLKDKLQEDEGSSYLPRQSDPWTFWKGPSEEVIRAGEGELLETLHNGTPEHLWRLVSFLNGTCTSVRVKLSY